MFQENSQKQEPSPKSLARRRGWIPMAAASVSVLGFVGLMAGGIGALHMRAAATISPKPTPPVTVTTLNIQKDTGYARTSRFVGRLEPARQTNIAFERGGLLMKLHADEGTRVRKGDIVAELDVEQLIVSRRQLEAQTRELKAQRELAELTLGRQKELRKGGWTPTQRYDEARTNLARFAASIERLSAQIDALNIDIRKSKLTAPFDGVISARQMDEGAIVSAGTPVLTLLEVDRRQARVGIPPEAAARLREGEAYRLLSGDHIMTGRLHSQRPDLQTGTRTVTALFDVVGGERVNFGELVTLEMESRVDEPGAWLPLTALKEGPKGLWTVLTIDDADANPTVRSEVVEVLHTRGENVFVRGTLSSQVRVVLNGTNRVVDGQQVALAQE